MSSSHQNSILGECTQYPSGNSCVTRSAQCTVLNPLICNLCTRSQIQEENSELLNLGCPKVLQTMQGLMGNKSSSSGIAKVPNTPPSPWPKMRMVAIDLYRVIIFWRAKQNSSLMRFQALQKPECTMQPLQLGYDTGLFAFAYFMISKGLEVPLKPIMKLRDSQTMKPCRPDAPNTVGDLTMSLSQQNEQFQALIFQGGSQAMEAIWAIKSKSFPILIEWLVMLMEKQQQRSIVRAKILYGILNRRLFTFEKSYLIICC